MTFAVIGKGFKRRGLEVSYSIRVELLARQKDRVRLVVHAHHTGSTHQHGPVLGGC